MVKRYLITEYFKDKPEKHFVKYLDEVFSILQDELMKEKEERRKLAISELPDLCVIDNS